MDLHANSDPGEIEIKLGSKGLYTWKISLPVDHPLDPDGEVGAKTVTQIVKIDQLLRQKFPTTSQNHKGTMKFVS